MLVNLEIHTGLCTPKSVPYTSTSAALSSSRLGWQRVIDAPFRQHDADSFVLSAPDRMCADVVVSEAELGFLAHLDLSDHPARRGVQPDEVDACRLSHQAAAAVASDDVLGSERHAVGQRDIDASRVLHDACDLAATHDGNAELADPVGQDGLEVTLPQRQQVVVPGAGSR